MNGIKKCVIGLMALFVLICVYWAIGRNVMIKTIGTHINQMQSEGYKVVHKGLSVGGFPLKFRAGLAAPDIASPRSIEKPWSIKADDVRLEALVFKPLKWTGTHRGEARIDMRGPKGERWLFDARPLNIDLTARAGFDGEIKSVELSGSKLKTQAVIGTLPPLVAIDEVRLFIAPNDADMRYILDLKNIYLEKDTLKNFQKIFGPRIESLDGSALAIGLTSLEQSIVQAWQQNGQIISEGWTMSWGGTILQGGFNLTQSEAGLSGIIRIEIDDGNRLISQLSEAGIFSARQARNAKLAAALLPTGQSGRQEIALTLKDGYLTLFGQRVFEL